MRFVYWSNVTWTLTALGAVVVLLTRIRLGGHRERSSGVSTVSPAVLGVHTTFGVIALGLWIGALATNDRLLAGCALAAWWIVTFAGLLLLARWLPSGGRHSDAKATDAWGEGAGLSLLAHVGTLLGVCYFTFITITDRL
jgi:hypothetical protein